MNQIKNRKKIVLLDFAQETNSGDAAMQVSIVSLVRKYFHQFNISVTTVFGANQFPEALSEFFYTSQNKDIDIVGGLYPTLTMLKKKEGVFKEGKIKKIGIALLMLPTLFFIVVKPLRLVYKKILPQKFKDSFKVYSEANFIIWNGRNFRGNGFWKEPFKIFELCFNPIVCILLKKPIVCIGASVWKIKNPLSYFILKSVFKKCLFVSARERYSYEYMQKIMDDDFNKKKLFQFPDLSLYILNQMSLKIKKENRKTKKVVGFTIVGERELQDENVRSSYINSFKNLIDKLYKEGFQFIIIPQVTFEPEQSKNITREIFSSVSKEDVKIISSKMTIEELLHEYSKLDILVATRMHSAIFALTVKTPVLAITYDTGAKWGILENIGIPKEHILSANNLSSIDLFEKFEDVWRNKDDILFVVNKTFQDNLFTDVENHIIYAKKAYNELLKDEKQ